MLTDSVWIRSRHLPLMLVLSVTIGRFISLNGFRKRVRFRVFRWRPPRNAFPGADDAAGEMAHLLLI